MPPPPRSARNTLLLFGPQIPRLIPTRLTELRKTIREDPNLEFLVRIVKDLPSLWESTIQENSARLGRLTGAKQQLQQLGAFLEKENGELPSARARSSLLLAPLTVVIQIAEYVRLGRQGSVQGFCVGFLAAAAVASARDRAELERWTGTAIGLAVCIGAVIDADQQERSHERPDSAGCSSAWSVRWTSAAEKEHLERTLECFPEVSGHQFHLMPPAADRRCRHISRARPTSIASHSRYPRVALPPSHGNWRMADCLRSRLASVVDTTPPVLSERRWCNS